ncbi:MAG: hypothetical protein GF346_08510, partial [Candidatus Eisenbacteria bacterium]|nr:hypothetical protein [Candidatus Latescibacterota bacterium]MBD3302476.1 hypothetical protein [Candidatus Eisenbacteria bacterium]
MTRRWAPILAALLAAGCAGERSAPAGPSEQRVVSEEPAAVEEGVILLEDLTDRQLFPADNWWNREVANAPVDSASDALIDFISGRSPEDPDAVSRMHPDFGPPPYGIPYVGVPGDQPLVEIHWTLYGDESDDGAPGRPPGYPVPEEAKSEPNYIEGGIPGGGESGDRHMLLVDRERWFLFETWATYWNPGLQRWEAGSGAVWNLATNDRRPDGWTSADAAGLAILPGLVRYDEVASGEPIAHAFRFTVRATNGYVWPASHA